MNETSSNRFHEENRGEASAAPGTAREHGNRAKRFRFRQERYQDRRENKSLEWDGRRYQMANWSRTGVAFESDRADFNPRAGDPINGLKVFVGHFEIFLGDGIVRWAGPVGEGSKRVGVQLTTSLFPTEGLLAVEEMDACVASAGRAVGELQEMDPEALRIMQQFRSSLRIIQESCQREERRWKNLSLASRAEAEKYFLEKLSREITKLFIDMNRRLGRCLDVTQLKEDSPYFALFTKEIYPFFESSEMGRRAFEKPRGYAGDYELMNHIYRGGYEGADIFGRVLHKYITSEISSFSVKFRRPYFFGESRRLLADGRKGKRILILASGPAVEVQDAVADWAQEELDRVSWVLLDIDREALEHAQSRIMEIQFDQNKRCDIEYLNLSIKTFLTGGPSMEQGFDLIYAGGLFDYLNNPTSAVLVQKFYPQLAANGRLIVGNFTHANPTKTFMALVTRWSLIHKTEDEMLSWTRKLPDAKVSIEYDPERINAFLVVRR